MKKAPIIEVSGLSFRYTESQQLLDNISLEVGRGEILCVTGSPGSGKTTLLRLITGELWPQAGSGNVLGQPLFTRKRAEARRLLRRIGVIRGDDLLLPGHDVFSAVALPLEIGGLAGQRLTRRVYATLHQVGLMGKARCKVACLSTTDRRLVSLATALVKAPDLILADLNPGECDQQTLLAPLMAAAGFGSALVLFSQKKVSRGGEYHLQGGFYDSPPVK